MPSLNIVKEHQVKRSSRLKQLEAMFDVPLTERSKVEWHGKLPIEDFNWNIGLIVGPSGSGKTVILNEVFGGEQPLAPWASDGSVIDDFSPSLSMEQITSVCQSVGFNTIPAWMRPWHVLSNGEKFRVELARHLLEDKDPVVLDEFTSVVDRQVAQVGSYAVGKYVREHNRQLVAASCHYDIEEWLLPDWVFEPATMTFTRRYLRRRPLVEVSITRTPYDTWKVFAPFHYMTASLNPSARCFALYASGHLASFTSVLHFPHPRVKDIVRASRTVTLPDWQGLGLAFILKSKVASAYAALGKRFHSYPSHPNFVRGHRSEEWRLIKQAGLYSPRRGDSSSVAGFGSKPCAVFEYVGPAMPEGQAREFLGL